VPLRYVYEVSYFGLIPLYSVAATEFRYYGMKRHNGGLFGICVDCDLNNPSYQTIDGFNGTDNGTNDPVSLPNFFCNITNMSNELHIESFMVTSLLIGVHAFSYNSQ
jgi:hypothetical protein